MRNEHSFLACLSLLTMTNPNQLCDVLLFVCSKIADEHYAYGEMHIIIFFQVQVILLN